MCLIAIVFMLLCPTSICPQESQQERGDRVKKIQITYSGRNEDSRFNDIYKNEEIVGSQTVEIELQVGDLVQIPERNINYIYEGEDQLHFVRESNLLRVNGAPFGAVISDDDELVNVIDSFGENPIKHLVLQTNPGEAGWKLVSDLSRLRSLHINSKNVTNEGIRSLRNLSSLRFLDLEDTNVTGEGLKHIGTLSGLHYLELSSLELSDASLKPLKPLTSLRSIHLTDTNVTGTGVNHLTELTSLRILDLEGTELKGKKLKNLSNFHSLQSLDLAHTRFTDNGLKKFQNVTSLRYLDLSDTNISDKGLKYLKDLTKLKYIYLIRTDITGEGFRHLKKHNSLQSLSLHSSEIKDIGLKHLESLRSLKSLNLSYTEVTSSGLQYLRNHTNLRYLFLKNTNVTDSGMKHLKNLTSLKRLQLMNTDVSGEGLKHIQNWNSLENLRLADTAVSDEGMKYIDRLKSLKALGVSETAVGNSGLKHIKQLKSLRWLDLSYTNVTGKGLEHLNDLPSLRKLTLTGTDIRDEHLKHLTKFSSLRVLHLDGTNITDEGTKHLKHLSGLDYLDISETKMTFLGKLKLTVFLKESSHSVQIRGLNSSEEKRKIRKEVMKFAHQHPGVREQKPLHLATSVLVQDTWDLINGYLLIDYVKFVEEALEKTEQWKKAYGFLIGIQMREDSLVEQLPDHRKKRLRSWMGNRLRRVEEELSGESLIETVTNDSKKEGEISSGTRSKITNQVKNLSAKSHQSRQEATQALKQHSPEVARLLNSHLEESDNPEAQKRLREILQYLAGKRFSWQVFPVNFDRIIQKMERNRIIKMMDLKILERMDR